MRIKKFFRRLFRRKEITTYHRCLAVHLHYANETSALR